MERAGLLHGGEQLLPGLGAGDHNREPAALGFVARMPGVAYGEVGQLVGEVDGVERALRDVEGDEVVVVELLGAQLAAVTRADEQMAGPFASTVAQLDDLLQTGDAVGTQVALNGRGIHVGAGVGAEHVAHLPRGGVARSLERAQRGDLVGHTDIRQHALEALHLL